MKSLKVTKIAYILKILIVIKISRLIVKLIKCFIIYFDIGIKKVSNWLILTLVQNFIEW